VDTGGGRTVLTWPAGWLSALARLRPRRAFEQSLNRHAAGGGASGASGASGNAPKPAAPATEERRSSTPLPDNKPPRTFRATVLLGGQQLTDKPVFA